jgi:hypothetical protein
MLTKKKTAILVLALAMCIGVASAALLQYYGKIISTVDVKQAIYLDGHLYNIPVEESFTATPGDTIWKPHYLESEANVPIEMMFDTKITNSSGLPDGDGIIVTYSTAILQQIGTGVAQWSTGTTHKGAYSVKLTTVTTDDIARAYVPFGATTLAEIGRVSFWTYVTHADNQWVRPWVGIYLHVNPGVTLEQWFADYYAGSHNVFYIQAEPCYTDGYSSDFNVWQYWDSEGQHPLKWESLEGPDYPYGAPTLQQYINGDAMSIIYDETAFASREYGTLYVVGIKFQAGYGGTWANFQGYVDDVTIGNEPWDLELFPEDTSFTLQPGERLDFYIKYEFATNIKPDVYTITTEVQPT